MMHSEFLLRVSHSLINTVQLCIHLILGKCSSDCTVMFYFLISLNFNKSTAGTVNKEQKKNQYSIIQHYSASPYGIMSVCLTRFFKYLQVVNENQEKLLYCQTRLLKMGKKWFSEECLEIWKVLNIIWQLIYVVSCISKIDVDILL